MSDTAGTVVYSPGEPTAAPEAPALTAAQTDLRQMVLDSVILPNAQRNYAKALDLLFALACSRPLIRALLLENQRPWMVSRPRR